MNLEYIKWYFNCNVEKEIERNKINAYARFTFNLQIDVMRNYIGGGGKYVLDAGCGSGSYAIEAAKMNNQIYLVDISNELITEASKLFSIEKLNHQLIGKDISDVRNLENISNQYFDYIICFGGVLNFLMNDVGLCLDEFHRVLKPSGAILVSLGSKYGAIKSILSGNPKNVSFILRHKEMFDLNEILLTGNIEQRAASDVPNRQIYSSYEFSKILSKHGFNTKIGFSRESSASGFFTSKNEYLLKSEKMTKKYVKTA